MKEQDVSLRRLAIRAADMVCTSSLEVGQVSTPELLKTLINPKSPKGERFRAGLHLVGTIIPGSEEFWASFLISTDRLPIAFSTVKLIDHGGENTVFLIEVPLVNNVVRKVFKVNRESIGLSKEELLGKAEEVRGAYETSRSWFFHIPGFILDEEFLVVHSYLLGMSGLVTVQPYLEGEINCFFNDYSEEEILSLMVQDATLRNNFSLFANQLLTKYYASGQCVDILGNRNLSIVKEKGQHHLILLDPHLIFDAQFLAERPLETTLRLIDRIGYIQSGLSFKKCVAIKSFLML